MIEYIPLRQPISTASLFAEAGTLAVVQASANLFQLQEIVGAVNGRQACKKTFCFVDREPNDVAQKQLEQALVRRIQRGK